MLIYELLNSELKNAMRSKDDVVKNYIRLIKSRITEYEVSNKLDRNCMPDDDVVIKVISSYKRSLEKAIEQFGQAEKSEQIVNEYKKEIVFCNRFLPNNDNIDIEKIVDEAINVVGNNVGKIMGHIMKNNKSLDGAVVKSMVIKKLQG